MTSYGPAPLRGTFDGSALPTITYNPYGAGGTGTWNIKAISVEWEDGGEEEEQTDGNGTVTGFIEKKPREILNLELIVQAGTKALAYEAIRPPDKFTTVTLANFIKSGFTFLNGDYAYTKGAKVKLAEGEDEDNKITIQLKKFFKPDGSAVPLTGAGGILVATPAS